MYFRRGRANSALGQSILAMGLCFGAAGGIKGQGIAPNPLRNTYYKLVVDKKLTIGYFGGSITAGSGASNPNVTSWRALTNAWLQKNFPAAAITQINAAIGGTGADLGAFRLKRDLLEGNPDLVFVEFAVNDGGRKKDVIQPCMEGIVRQIRARNRNADIVFIYTTSKSLAAPYDAGQMPSAVVFQQGVADHYILPAVNVGKKLWEEIRAGRETWASLLPDGTHPNDKGMLIYALEVQAFLGPRLAGVAPAALAPWASPTVLTPNPIDAGDLVDSWTLDTPGWQKQDTSLAGRFPHRIASNMAGTLLRHTFRGTAVGVYWLVGPESGDIEWSIDGSAPVRASSWDQYALNGNKRAHYNVFTITLKPEQHILTIKVLGLKNPESKGTWIHLGALLVNGISGPTLARSKPVPSRSAVSGALPAAIFPAARGGPFFNTSQGRMNVQGRRILPGKSHRLGGLPAQVE